MSWAYRLTDGWNCAQLDQGIWPPNDQPKKKWKAFQPAGTPPRYTRDRVVDVKHIKLEIRLDVPRKSIAGVAHLTVRPIADAVSSLELDAVQLRVSAVSCRGKRVPFTNTGEKLALTFAPPLAPDGDVTITVRYAATPKRGLYFIGPDKNHPRKPAQVWSQGEEEDNRRWFPCFDYPNEKATSELLATVPADWFCLSNGRLVALARERGAAVFHWAQEVPHASYLITLCAGRFVEVRDEWDSIPVNFYVPPGRVADGKRAFGRTPAMMKHYSELIGVRYPFAKYAQVAVADFIFGGMENTSATTQTDRTLHDARAHLDYSSEPLVSHELVHSWFGNLVTCRDWSHAWLNESFATLFDNLWYRHARGEDEFRYEMYADLRAYLEEDSQRYRRPIVTNVYREPTDMFDRHLYQKGACFLNLLREMLGDRLFFLAVKLYVERFRERTAITQDFLNVLEDATGRNFEWLFDQWIYKGGHPEFEVACTWDRAAGAAALTVRQKQSADELTPVFRLPLKVRFVGQGYDETRSFDVAEAQHVFHVPLPARPRWIAFDPGNTIPKTLELRLDEDQLAAQLKEDDDVMGRAYAAQALGKRGSAAALKALAAALRRDRSYFVEAEALAALGNTRAPAVWDVVLAALRRDSHLDIVRAEAFRGLLELDAPRALEVLESWSQAGRPEYARWAALGYLGRAARETDREAPKARVRRLLEQVLADGFHFDRLAALRSLRELRDRAALPALDRLLKDADLNTRVRRAVEETQSTLREEGGLPPEVKALREQFDKLRSEADKLKEQVQKLEARKKAPAKGRKRR